MEASLVTRVRNRLQFVILLALFYPVMLGAFFVSMEQEFASSFTLLKYGAVIGVLTLDYLVLEIIGSRLSHIRLKIIDTFLLAQIAAYVPVFIVFGMIQNGDVSGWWGMSFWVGIACLTAIPLGVLMYLIWCVTHLSFSEVYSDAKLAIAVVRDRGNPDKEVL